MHLLTAQPGGFVDEDGIIDLNQTPAELVILSAADSALAALSAAANTLPENYPSIRLANWVQLTKPSAFDLYQHSVLEQARIVILSLLGGQSYWDYGLEQLKLWAKQKGRTLIVVPGDDSPDPDLFDASTVTLEEAIRVWRYLRESGVNNATQLFYYLADRFTDNSYQWREPKILPRSLIYKPGLDHATLSDWQREWKKQTSTDKPVVLLLMYRSHLQSGNTVMFDQLIDTLTVKLNPLVVAVSSLKDPQSIALVNQLIEQCNPLMILNTTSFASNVVETPTLSTQTQIFQSPFVKEIPVLQLLLSSSTKDDWSQNSRGLRARDIAMQVVLPEMDGRIIGKVISFKCESYYDQRCQISVLRFVLHRERAEVVTQLTYHYCLLHIKKNKDKRIALILANYPTRDGRIGNGVGLDTPASTIALLNALKKQGYTLSDLPENGNQLIERLLGAITNNPSTLHHLPCWQSISLADYQRCFLLMPESNQQAIIERWGDVEQDPKFRNGRLMLSGIRLGEIFVGIQPARGFDRDLAANYHDPDLVPPHNYLAFYFWLQACYQVDALIHVGKHGNLEWLPGKGSALSNQCWPDITLAALPHFYPFIVNDPGEGAQAKRRAHAVIIDHLMPPMTRAQTYGELAELEILVDEYYQAMNLDARRQQWLKEKILQQVRDTHVLEELKLTKEADEEAVLGELDTYLCDIKEAQIRGGLHILGKLPDEPMLVDTLLALIRLPRGDSDIDQGILHNIAIDLNLRTTNGELFDPLKACTEPWTGLRPLELINIDDSLWRTEMDTRERLEILANIWIQRYVINGEEIESLKALYPRSANQLVFCQQQLIEVLKQSAYLEIHSLMDGLSGKFVPPGPSGAPTRGRLDTLPTGRNFYSVDNRSIPSTAAWALGQLSAQALIERHLQDHGDYPRQLGLSVWGTATMRTGGDDIAQAFSLMGVRPKWAQGSQRVIDIEVIPAMQLGRPRVDVTLRVSGFFRDAFPNVMKLYDSAVQAIIHLDEPGSSNTIRQHVEARTAELMAEGLDDDDACRQASFRVFGSKPGAYGAGLQGLIDERCWENSSDLARAYVNWGGYAYGNMPGDGVEAKQAFKHRLSQIEVVVQNQDNREHDILDSDDYYQFQGGMSNAVNTLSGQEPAIYHSDHSNPAAPVIRTLQEELNRVVRSRVLNPKWIKAMQGHGYKGAFEMSATVDYLFAYDATTNIVADYQYEKVSDALIFDTENQQFLRDNNPHALEEMAERLLEAVQRGMWEKPGEYAQELQNLLLEMDARREQHSE
ncbi:MAG: cobaltochelatase subunit CobN [Spongiibacteraceae bacterium]|nr:cobaltochelatase subunit CobN [Spongiibacteraceae bacterium]